MILPRNGQTRFDLGKDFDMTAALEALVAKAKKIEMTEGQVREQRLSFVYGNTHIENDRITRDMVEAADDRVTKEESNRG